MNPEHGFLQAIRENPDDEVSRLIFADWLEDHEQPERAKLIRLQCQAAPLRPRTAAHVSLENQASKLIKKHLSRWHPRARGLTVTMDRGLLHVTIPEGRSSRTGVRRWFAENQPWIIEADFTFERPGELDRFMHAGLLSQISGLCTGMLPVDMKALRSLEALTQLRSLEIEHTDLDNEGDGALEPLRQLRGLRSLVTHDLTLPPSALKPLSRLRHLQRLAIRIDLSAGDLSPLAELSSLEDLECGFEQSRYKRDLTFLADLTKLKKMYFHDGSDPGTALRYLAKTETLRTLRITHILISATTVKEVSRFPQLEELELCPTDEVGEGWMRHLRPLQNLQYLELSISDYIQEGDLTHLQALPRLETLNIDLSNVTGEGLQAVVGIPNLKHLFFARPGARLTIRDMKLFQQAEQLVSLDLSGASVSDSGIKQLGTVRSLRWINLRDVEVSSAALNALQKALPDTIIEH